MLRIVTHLNIEIIQYTIFDGGYINLHDLQVKAFDHWKHIQKLMWLPLSQNFYYSHSPNQIYFYIRIHFTRIACHGTLQIVWFTHCQFFGRFEVSQHFSLMQRYRILKFISLFLEFQWAQILLKLFNKFNGTSNDGRLITLTTPHIDNLEFSLEIRIVRRISRN